MSFAKGLQLLRLAEMAAARYGGVSLAEIEAEFDVNIRTAQRMTQALETHFPGVETEIDHERRKRWKLPAGDLRIVHAQGIRDRELYGLDWAIERAAAEGDPRTAGALRSLRDRVVSMMPRSHALRAESDAEALLEAAGYASRPGPRVETPERLLDLLAEAMRSSFCLRFAYRGARDGAATERVVEPHGILLGIRRYLVARPVGGNGRFRQYRLDRIGGAEITGETFRRDPAFRLPDHAARAFGSYQDDAEYGEVVWRFAPEAAATAREFIFHPGQQVEEAPDGGLIVRFHASGWLEMTWHLYQWGDAVEVLGPEALRRMVQDHRRSDFAALP